MRARQTILSLTGAAAFAAALSVSTVHARPDRGGGCRPLPGVERLWRGGAVRFVMFGEIHGTNEIPAMVADAACQAARQGPVVIALELDETLQPRIDAYLQARDPAAALNGLGATGLWTDHSDGRVGVAMIRLLERVRQMRRSGLPVDVRVIDSGGTRRLGATAPWRGTSRP
ncbi:MAG: hypothetical protein K1X35_06435 [Caulobacteraceae bacterium]|nr:hypothetical protein [Caulobacteraceae bacterium]